MYFIIVFGQTAFIVKYGKGFGDILLEQRDGNIMMVIFFSPLTALFILVWPKKQHTIVCTVFANNQQGNHALIVQMKA